jgi:hypothetical protein
LIRRRRRWYEAALLALVAAAIPFGSTRAQLFRLSLEPGYRHIETDITDQSGRTTSERSDLLTQSYRLSLDRAITDRLLASAGGTLLDERGWTTTNDVESFSRGRATTLFGRLTLGLPTLTATAGADRREQRVLSSAAPSFITESFSGTTSWRPIGLPELDLRLSRSSTHDASRRVQDTTTDNAIFGTRYGGPNYDLRYLLSWSRTADELNATESTAIDQALLGTRSDVLFNGRTTTYVSGTFQSRNSSTVTGGAGFVSRQQSPVNGLSAIEAFPATPVNVALAPNPPLVDGNTTTSATVNVGFGPSAAGDRNARDVGAQFGDLATPVNTIHVWFDRSITAVGTALAASVAVYQSIDNQTWTPVGIAAPPTVSPLENRIEITIAQVQARYLKVTLQPLPPGLTADPSFRDVFVTEVQFFLVLPAALVPRDQSSYGVAANGTARTLIWRPIDFAHDVQLSVTRRSDAGVTTYTLVNGLSVARKLTQTLAANARGARQDQDLGQGHEGLWQWTAALNGTPYPTAFWTLNYSGTKNDDEESIAHSVTALARADWYEGISTQATAGASYFTQAERIVNNIPQSARETTAGQASGTASFTPNRFVTVTAGVLYSRSVSFTPETGDVVSEFARADASLTFTPAPALSAAGTVSRVLLGERPTTLATMQLNYFPLRGDLQLTFAYSKTLDTAAEATTEVYGPTLRWNLRRGVSLTSSYTFVENVAPVQLLQSRVLSANLLVAL